VAPEQPNLLDALLQRLVNVEDPLVRTWAADLIHKDEVGAEQQHAGLPCPKLEVI
jgi:hypothetical protein